MKNLALLPLCLALFLLGGSGARASLDLQRFERVVVFGDSLSDNGNLFAITKGEDPPSPYGVTFDGTNRTFPGRFIDGQNWVDYLPLISRQFPTVIAYFKDPQRENATNFAVGGAVSTDLLTSDAAGLPAQIPTYLMAATSGKASPDDLYVIWIGANDFGAGIAPEVTVENIREGIAQLSEASAKTFVVINIPDISLTPDVKALGPATIQAAKEFVSSVNVLLEAELPPCALSHRVTIDLVDINRISVPVVLNPGRFGFTNSVGAAFDPSSGLVLVPDPNDYVFWDGFHPTTNVHYIAAEFIYHAVASRYALPQYRLIP
jgi:phospholipase/lecithinase/hemolysin